MWIATHGGGINLLQETADGEIRFLHNGNLLKDYSKDKFNKVRVIKEVNNTLLVGTTEGLITFSAILNVRKRLSFIPMCAYRI